jgi:hypothetical protein
MFLTMWPTLAESGAGGMHKGLAWKHLETYCQGIKEKAEMDSKAGLGFARS